MKNLRLLSVVLLFMFSTLCGLAQEGAVNYRERTWALRDLQEFFALGSQPKIEKVMGAPDGRTETAWTYRGFRVADEGSQPRLVSVKLLWGEHDGQNVVRSVQIHEEE